MISPWTGIPILLAILCYGVYWFVGDFGAGVLVDFLEGTLFEEKIKPWIRELVTSLLPWKSLQDLLVGEYGLITLGVRYAVALILPIVATFFLVFSLLEDTGHLPRLSLLMDRVSKAMGLTGRAVIPMVLGPGCNTMATMVIRTLPTLRERLIATLLLALAVPCSAQLGVTLSLQEGSAAGLWIWLGGGCLCPCPHRVSLQQGYAWREALLLHGDSLSAPAEGCQRASEDIQPCALVIQGDLPRVHPGKRFHLDGPDHGAVRPARERPRASGQAARFCRIRQRWPFSSASSEGITALLDSTT